jgi:hypothetical protein
MAKNIFNDSLDKNKYEIIHTKTFEFYEKCHLAASSVLTPERDFLGKVINDFSKINEDINFYRFIFLTIFPQNKKTYVLLSFLRRHRKSISPLMSQIQQCSILRRKIVFSNLLAINSDNLAISPKVWDRLPESTKLEFIDVFEGTAFAEEDSMLSLKDINLFI